MFRKSGALSSETNKDNLLKLTLTEAVSCEKRIIELYEYAALFATSAYSLSLDGVGIYEILGALFEPERNEIPCEGALPENVERIRCYTEALASVDRALFVSLFAQALAERGLTLTESDFLPSGDGEESFTYVKNRLADEAYDVLSQDFSDPRVFYAADLREAARAVKDGRVAYCLLPLEERGGVRIGSVSELLYSFDLKINAVTPVFGFDGNADMKYALVSRFFTVPEINEDDDRYLEIRLPLSDNAVLTELMSAVSALGVSVYRINSSTAQTEEGKGSVLSVVLASAGGSFAPLLTYLSVFMPSYTAVGIYNNLE